MSAKARRQHHLRRLIRKAGVPVTSHREALLQWAHGGQLYAIHEMDGRPKPVANIEHLLSFTADQLIVLPQGAKL